MSKEEKSKRRMSLPKKEEDIEVSHEEPSELEEHHHEHLHEEISPEDYNLLLMNTLVHTLGHVESDLTSLNQSMKQLMSQIDGLRKSMELIARILLIDKIKDQELRKKLIDDIINELSKT